MMRVPLTFVDIEEFFQPQSAYILFPSILPIIVGVTQVLWGLILVRSHRLTWYIIGIAGTILQVLLWLIILYILSFFEPQIATSEDFRYLAGLIQDTITLGISIIVSSIMYISLAITTIFLNKSRHIRTNHPIHSDQRKGRKIC